VVVRRAPPLTSLTANYHRLHYPADAPAADARYTRYVDPATIFRTHMSALIPGALADVRRAELPDVLITCPGLVYRRDHIGRLSTGEPHQVDLWRVTRGGQGRDDLLRMIEVVLAAAAPGRRHRCNEVVHPYTDGGLEIEVQAGDRWVEVGECGLILPALLDEAGFQPDTHGGLAMGLGLDRLFMLRKGIDDIRLLRSDDPRIARQMLDLSPYQPVSLMPPIRRDISIAVAPDRTMEEVADRVREALGAEVRAVEEITILSSAPFSELPPAAAERLGAHPGQRNVLVRIVVRHPERTLTDAEANQLRDRIYPAVHEGDRMMLTTPS
jgi:phenylalanyl-tRNA synthetase alpha chain